MRRLLACLLLASVSSTVCAQTASVPNVFTAGTPAKAADVNANFAALVAAINSLSARVSTLEGRTASVAGLQIVTTSLACGDSCTLSVACPSGKKVLGGGYQYEWDRWVALQSYPSADNTWFVNLARQNELPGNPPPSTALTVYAICATQ